MFEYDNSYVALDRRAAQRFAGLDTAVTGVELGLRDPWEARSFAGQLEARLGYPHRALDWQSQNASLFSGLKPEKLAKGPGGVLICVGAPVKLGGPATIVVAD